MRQPRAMADTPEEIPLRNRPLRIDIVGASERVVRRFEAVFQGPGKGHGILVNATVAEVALMDMDGPDAQGRWSRYRAEFPHRPIIAISVSEPGAEFDVFLRKPIHIEDLLQALVRLGKSLDLREQGPEGSRESENSNLVGLGDKHLPVASGDPSPLPRGGKAADGGSRASEAALGAEQTGHLPESPCEPEPTIAIKLDPRVNVSLSSTAGCEAGSRTPLVPGFQSQSAQRGMAIPADPPGFALQIATPSPSQTLAMSPPELDSLCSSALPDRLQNGVEGEREQYSDRCGTAAEVNLHDPDQVQALLLPVHDRLLGVVKGALEQPVESRQGFVRLITDQGVIGIDASRRWTFSNLTDRQLQVMCQQIYGPHEILLETSDLTAGEQDTFRQESGDALLWKLALWTYRGRLPANTHLADRVYLRRWPNLTRFLEIPHALRIAALWTEQSLSPIHVAEALRIPQRYVFAFYGAAYTIGLAGQAKRQADYLFQPALEQRGTPRLSLLRIVQRLREMVRKPPD